VTVSRNPHAVHGLRASTRSHAPSVPGDPSEALSCLVDLKEVTEVDPGWATEYYLSITEGLPSKLLVAVWICSPELFLTGNFPTA